MSITVSIYDPVNRAVTQFRHISFCIARLRFWWKDHLSCSGGDSAYPSFEQFSSWPHRWEVTRWVVYLGLLPDNKLYRPVGLVPRKVLLVRAGWSAVRRAQRLSQCFLRH